MLQMPMSGGGGGGVGRVQMQIAVTARAQPARKHVCTISCQWQTYPTIEIVIQLNSVEPNRPPGASNMFSTQMFPPVQGIHK